MGMRVGLTSAEKSGSKPSIFRPADRGPPQPFRQDFGMCGFDPPAGSARRTTGVAPSWNPQDGRHFSLQEQLMSAKKLGRLAGLVFVLAAVIGGASIAHGLAAHGGAGSVSAVAKVLLETIWG